MKFFRSLSSTWYLVGILVIASILRLWQLGSVPNGLYIDEMDVGYQAYSFLKTGADYFGNSHPLVFHSLADFRAPMLIYVTVPFVQILGLSAWAVRLPAAIFGGVSIYLLYLVTAKLFDDKRMGLIAALLLAISPWHIQYSRMTFEVTLLLSFFLLGLYGFLRGLDDKRWLVISAISFGLTVWTYNTAKLFVPLFVILAIAIYWKRFWHNKTWAILFAVIGIVVASPIYLNSLTGTGNLRFSEISIFDSNQASALVNESRKQAALKTPGSTHPAIIEKLIYNKPLVYAQALLGNYAQSFSPDFLFIKGDPNIRHSPSATTIGQFYYINFVGMIIGLAALVAWFYRYRRQSLLLIGWILLSPLPAALTKEGGMHATRLFFLLPALTILTALGIVYMWSKLKGKIRVAVFALYGLLLILEAGHFVSYYFGPYKLESARVFNYGFNQVATIAKNLSPKYDVVYIDGYKEWPLMAYVFTNKMDPKTVQNVFSGDKGEYLDGLYGFQFGNVVILDPNNKHWLSNPATKNSVFVISAEAVFSQDPFTIDSVIRYPDNTPAFLVGTYE